MSHLRSAGRFLATNWILAIAVVVNLAIAAPVGAVRYDNDICETADGGGIEECCTICWFFCNCTIDAGDDGDGDGDGDGGGGDGGDGGVN